MDGVVSYSKPNAAITTEDRRTHDPYTTAIGILGRIRERLEDNLLFMKATEEKDSVALEWGYMQEHFRTALRYSFYGCWREASTNAWLAVESANRAEAYFELDCAVKRICGEVVSHAELGRNLLSLAQNLRGVLREAHFVTEIFEEELARLGSAEEDLECMLEDLYHRAFELSFSIAESGGVFGDGGEKPLDVLKRTTSFCKEEVPWMLGSLSSFVTELSSLGRFVFGSVRDFSKFASRKGVIWDQILDMADALGNRRPLVGEVSAPSSKGREKKPLELDPCIAATLEQQAASRRNGGKKYESA